MPRLVSILAVGLLGVASLPAAAQQLQQAPPPPPRVTPAPQDRQPVAPIPASPDKRPSSNSPIRSEGPARLRPQAVPARPTQQKDDDATTPGRVLDATGRELHGMRRVDRNRAFDPATGRYYRTTDSGQLVGPPPRK